MGTEKLVRLVQRIASQSVNSLSPSDLLYATYTGQGLQIDSKPLPVALDMVDIPKNLVVIEGLLSMDITEGFEIEAFDEADRPIRVERIALTDVPVTIKTELKPGERVSVVQKAGGQRFGIIDRLGETK